MYRNSVSINELIISKEHEVIPHHTSNKRHVNVSYMQTSNKRGCTEKCGKNIK